MYDAFIMSLLVLLLFGAFLICVADTFAPFLMNRSNMGDLWPLLHNSAKVSIAMTAVCVVLILISSGKTTHNPTIIGGTGGMFVWSFAILAWVKVRKSSLDKAE